MSICSAHRSLVVGCEACNTSLEDNSTFQAGITEAEQSGIHKCANCGFEYYKISDLCPKCSSPQISLLFQKSVI